MNAQRLSSAAHARILAAVALTLAVGGSAWAEEERHVAPSRGGGEPPAQVLARSSSSSDGGSSGSSSSGSHDGGAVPVDRARSGGHHGGGHQGGGHHGDGWHGGGGHGGGGHGGGWRGRTSSYWGWGWGPYYYWPWWWGGYYDPPYYYGPSRYRDPYRGYDDDAMGALDFDVSPERAQIFLDGQPIGVADDFDGFPTYLWLPKGTYDVVIYLDGYETIARQYSVYPGVVIDVEDGMVPGESKRPEELMPKEHPRRDQRVAEEREQERRAERAEAEERRAEERRPGDAAAEAARVVLKITPADASVYLDGRFLGTAGELGRLRSGLILDSGRHRLEIVRPGYESETSDLAIEPGEEVTISLDLEKSDR